MAAFLEFATRRSVEYAQNLIQSQIAATVDKENLAKVEASARSDEISARSTQVTDEVKTLAFEIVKEAGARVVGFTAIGFVVGVIAGAPLAYTALGCLSGIVHVYRAMNAVTSAEVSIEDQKDQKIFYRIAGYGENLLFKKNQ